MPTVVVASTHPAKGKAVVRAWQALFGETPRIRALAVSGPSGLPVGEKNMYAWAARRLREARVRAPEADFWVAIEAGIHPFQGRWWMTAWVLVEDALGRKHAARAAAFALPLWLQRALQSGCSFSQALARRWPPSLARQRQTLGLIGVLSASHISREDLYVHPVMLALLPWINPLS